MSGDQLSKLARDLWGDMKLWPAIFAANRDRLDDADDIFVGQVLRIPQRDELPTHNVFDN